MFTAEDERWRYDLLREDGCLLMSRGPHSGMGENAQVLHSILHTSLSRIRSEFILGVGGDDDDSNPFTVSKTSHSY